MSTIASTILNHFPGAPRPVQEEALLTLEKHWNDYDVFVIQAPTASGKSRIAMTIADWQGEVDVLTPTNILLSQYVKEFPDFPRLMRHDFYECYNHCRTLKRGKSSKCQYAADKARVKESKRGLMNYYMYMSLNSGWQYREVAPTVILDEAHNLVPVIQSLEASRMWKHTWHWPDSLSSYDDVLKWVKDVLRPDKPWTPEKRAKLEALKADLDTFKPQYVIERTKELWRRTKPSQLRDVLLLKPVNIRSAKPYFWRQLGGSNRRGVNKVVLMSATIGRKDIESLGLDKHRVLYLDCESPIAPERRPVVKKPVATVTYNTLEESADKLARYIENTLLPKHKGEKGVIHATYAMSDLLRERLSSDRFIFHHRTDKTARYNEFLEAESDRVLVASGLYEGIDLPHDLGRWQAVAKVPWPSLGDKAVKYKAEMDSEWYNWQVIKDLCQAAGRVCRTPDDYGITYILDKTFDRLEEESSGLFPKAFQEGLNAGEKL